MTKNTCISHQFFNGQYFKERLLVKYSSTPYQEPVLSVFQHFNEILKRNTVRLKLALCSSVFHAPLYILQGYIYYIYTPDIVTRNEILKFHFQEVK
jgi:hypothetical protein